MKLLACFNETRAKVAPNVPTLRELGYIDHPVGVLLIIAGPRGLQDSILKKLEDALLKAMRNPAHAKFMDKIEMIPLILGAKETAKNVDSQAKFWGELVKLTGMREKE